MKRVWKPLDVGGLRLYKVIVYFVNHPQWSKAEIVAATSPTHAADIYRHIHRDTVWVEEPFIEGMALSVNIPEDWHTEGVPCLECEPQRWRR